MDQPDASVVSILLNQQRNCVPALSFIEAPVSMTEYVFVNMWDQPKQLYGEVSS